MHPESSGVGSSLDGLTPREQVVARLVAEGLTNQEIAQTLSISVNTVKKLLKQVFARLWIDNRTQLATLVARADAMSRA